MKRKILDIEQQPPLTTYCILGSTLSIVQNSKGYLDWLYSSFMIPVYFDKLVTYETEPFDCPWIIKYKITREMINAKWKDIIKFVIDSIDSGLYVYLFVDRYYISASIEYKKAHEDHELFIYGYDKTDKTIYIADNLAFGKYVYMKCSFNELRKGYRHLYFDKNMGVTTMSISANDYILDINEIKEKLIEYLNPTKSKLKYSSFWRKGLSTFYLNAVVGFDIYNTIREELHDLLINEYEIDKRTFHLLWEHKNLMKHRIIYLHKKKLIDVNKKILDYLHRVEENFFIVLNLCIKYNIVKDKEIIQRIINYIDITVPIERIALSKIIELI